MAVIDKDILARLTQQQLVDLAAQQQMQLDLQEQIMANQEARIKELEMDVSWYESALTNKRSVDSQP